MARAYLFYNPLAGQGKVLEDLDALEFVLDAPCVRCDMTKPETYCETLFAMEPEDHLVLCGGDGTLHRFVNLTQELDLPNEIWYYPAGTHNDFARDFGQFYGCSPFSITQVLRELPRVQMGNRNSCFLTGILFAACGEIRRTSRREAGYTDKNTPKTVCITVDGNGYSYEKVWLAAVMRGEHCAGMTPDPRHRRDTQELSCVLIHDCGRLRARRLIRRLRQGKTIFGSRRYAVHRGAQISIDFDSPVSLRMDGEPVTASALAAGRTEEKENTQ